MIHAGMYSFIFSRHWTRHRSHWWLWHTPESKVSGGAEYIDTELFNPELTHRGIINAVGHWKTELKIQDSLFPTKHTLLDCPWVRPPCFSSIAHSIICRPFSHISVRWSDVKGQFQEVTGSFPGCHVIPRRGSIWSSLTKNGIFRKIRKLRLHRHETSKKLQNCLQQFKCGCNIAYIL